jgi:protein phosphatase 1G
MEDAHILKSDFGPDVSLFGVFDGHGGREVSAYVEKHFLAELQKNQAFQQQKFEDALVQTFMKMDELMRTPEGNKEVLSLKEGDDDRIYPHKLIHRNLCWMHSQRGPPPQEHLVRG